MIVVAIPLIGGGTGEFGIPEKLRGKRRKADRAWTPGWICERMRKPKGEKRKANDRSPRTL
jgi:hypothetical protein